MCQTVFVIAPGSLQHQHHFTDEKTRLESLCDIYERPPPQPPRITKIFVSYKEIPTHWLPLARAGGPSVCLTAAQRTVKWTGVVILHEVNLESKDIPQDRPFSSQTPPKLCISNLLKKLLILPNKYPGLMSPTGFFTAFCAALRPLPPTACFQALPASTAWVCPALRPVCGFF